MARGHQKAQSQAKGLERNMKNAKKVGPTLKEQKKLAEKKLTFQCSVCKSLMPDPKTYKQHFENKHPSATLPEELKDVQS